MRRNAFSRMGLVALALVSVVPVITAASPATAQTEQAEETEQSFEAAPAGPPVILFAAPEDAGTFIPPAGVSNQRAATALSVAAPITFESGFPDEAKPAVQAAVETWRSLITSSQPITMLVSYGGLGPGTLAASGPTSIFRDFANAPQPGTWYPGPLAEALSGQNLGGSDFDVTITINDRQDWYFETDGEVPNGRFDLRSVVLHEVGHGLGFLGTMTMSGGTGSWGIGSPPRPDAYDRFVEDSSGQRLLSYSNGSAALGTALRSGAVYFDSPQTNRGQADRLRLYAPNPWSEGTSIAHLDESTYPPGSANSLMTPFLNTFEAVHATGPLVLCVLEALGWTTAQNCVPPVPTVQAGNTWPTQGGRINSGPPGHRFSAFGTRVTTGRGYRLVTGLDAGIDRPCAWDTVPINDAVVYPNSVGTIAAVSGPINRPPGRWQVCFREETTGATAYAAAPFVFTIR